MLCFVTLCYGIRSNARSQQDERREITALVAGSCLYNPISTIMSSVYSLQTITVPVALTVITRSV